MHCERAVAKVIWQFSQHSPADYALSAAPCIVADEHELSLAQWHLLADSDSRASPAVSLPIYCSSSASGLVDLLEAHHSSFQEKHCWILLERSLTRNLNRSCFFVQEQIVTGQRSEVI